MPVGVSGFYDPETSTVTYVLADTSTGRAAVIDSVLDYDPASGRTSRRSADRVISFVRERSLGVDWILETHVHADHLSAAPLLQQHLGGKIGIGAYIPALQRLMGPMFGAAEPAVQPFDHLFDDGERFQIGSLSVQVMHTPGHTPACCTYVAEDAAFVGDTLFMPDFGTARCDFPGGDARTMYRSIQRILALPANTRLFTGHDYPGDRRPAAWESTVAEQRATNKHLGSCADEGAFVALRTARDATLKMPTLILPAVQVNLRAGRLPDSDEQGRRYIKVPIDVF